MDSLAAELLALLAYGPLVGLLHEVGHALGARPGGFRMSSFGVGLGRPLWRIELRGGVVFHVDSLLLAGGACVAIPVGHPGLRRAWFHGGGLLVQLLLGLLLLGLPDTWFLDRVEQFNVLVALTNLVPWRWRGLASDGWYLWNVLTGGRRSSEILPQRSIFEALAHRERELGSPLGQAWASVCLAWVDILAGRPESAAPLFASDPAATVVDPWIDAVYAYLQAEWHRTSGRPLRAVRVAREVRVALGPSLLEAGADLLTLAEARALVDAGGVTQPQLVLARMSGASGPTGRQGAAVALAIALDGDPDDLELATWRVVRHVHETWLDPADVVLVLEQAADRLQAHGRIRAAQGARLTSQALADRTLRTASRADRLPLARRMAQLPWDPDRADHAR